MASGFKELNDNEYIFPSQRPLAGSSEGSVLKDEMNPKRV